MGVGRGVRGEREVGGWYDYMALFASSGEECTYVGFPVIACLLLKAWCLGGFALGGMGMLHADGRTCT